MTNTLTKIEPEFIISPNDEVLTSSREVAQYFEKQHKDVLRSIENMECSEEFSRRNFTPSDYIDSRGKKQPIILMTKKGFIRLVMSFTGKKAGLIMEAYINRYEELEKEVIQKNAFKNIDFVALYTLPHFRPWTKVFPDEFFQEIYRWFGWEWGAYGLTHPSYIGKIINKWVYDLLPSDVHEYIKANVPRINGKLAYKKHQILSEDFGLQQLSRHLDGIISLMKASQNYAHFEELAGSSFSKKLHGRQLKFLVLV